MFKDWIIDRVYKCSNKKCEGIIGCKQRLEEDFLKECPFCGKKTLLIESGNCGLGIMTDITKVKTMGALIDKSETKVYNNVEKPFWRNKNKIDFSILKDPKTYIGESK